MSIIHWASCKATKTCHGTMDDTVGQKGAVDVIRCYTGNSSNHVRRICIHITHIPNWSLIHFKHVNKNHMPALN